MQIIIDWLIEKRFLLGSLAALVVIFRYFVEIPKAFKSVELSAEDIARKVIEKQGDKKVEVLEEQMKQLTLTVEDLKNRRTEPDASPGIDSALKELEDGNTGKAENIFRQVLQDKVKEGKEANREAAEAARHLGALAFLHDTRSALDAYQQAVELDPENPDGWNQLGHLQRRIGELNAAIQSYNHVLQIGEAGGQKKWLAVATGNLGLIYKTRGELEKAEEHYRKSLAINEELGRKEGMASDYGNLGNIYQTRGELEEARDVWGKSKSLFLALGADHMAEKVQGLIDGLDSSEGIE